MDLSQRTFASNYFIFMKILFQYNKELIWCMNYQKIHVYTFLKGWRLFEGDFFSVNVLMLTLYYLQLQFAKGMSWEIFCEL